MKRGSFARAVGLIAAVTLLSSAAFADDSQSLAGLSIDRILGGPNHGDVVQFAGPQTPQSPFSSSREGLKFSLGTGAKNAATLFGHLTELPGTDAAAQSFSQDAQVLGLSVKLLGTQGSVSFINASPNERLSTPGAASQGPAVFAFYNFPQAQSQSPIGSILGLHTTPAALAGETDTTADASGSASGLLTFPLVNSLSAQGPYWYGGYTPALAGSSVQLSIPIKLASLGLKVRLGEQSLQAVGPTSLASQILGPAFATASNYNSFNGGMTVALPLLNRRATVSLDGLYETLAQTNGSGLGASNLPALGIAPSVPASGPIVLYPGSTDLEQYVGAASLALPVSSRLTVRGSFSEQLAGSVDLNALTQSLTQHTTAYAGGLVYNIPKTNSSINLFFNRNVYTDDAAPSSTWSENQQNLYFSVKF
ncbi:MAG TPA: hypothetical protein VEJ41_04795 [Candidatus Acidoferrales bacterium]|nr:hypothetical protein [Candidatus Acidoferrales bacterium]